MILPYKRLLYKRLLVYSLGVLSIRAPFPRSEEPRGDEGGGAADDVDGPAAGDVDGAHLPEPAAVDPVRREAVDDEAQRGEGAVGAHVAPVGTRNNTACVDGMQKLHSNQGRVT